MDKVIQLDSRLVDVLIPVRAPAPWLNETLEALQLQTHTDWRLILVIHGVDDGFTNLVSQYSLDAVILHAPQTYTLPKVLNLGLGASSAPFIARLDADDIPRSDRFEQQLAYLLADDNLVAVGSSAAMINEKSETIAIRMVPLKAKKIIKQMGWKSALIHPAVMFRNNAVSNIGGYSEDALNVEDFDLWLRLMCVGNLGNIGEPLLKYRLHFGQVTQTSKIGKVSRMRIRQSRLALAAARKESRVMALLRHEFWSTRQLLRRIQNRA